MLQLLDINHRICHSRESGNPEERSLDPQSSWGWQIHQVILRVHLCILVRKNFLFHYTYKKLAWILDKRFRGWQWACFRGWQWVCFRKWQGVCFRGWQWWSHSKSAVLSQSLVITLSFSVIFKEHLFEYILRNNHISFCYSKHWWRISYFLYWQKGFSSSLYLTFYICRSNR